MAGNANMAGRSVVSKVAEILRCFEAGSPCTLSELSRLSVLPMSTTYRLVTDLVAAGIVRRTPDGVYQLRYRAGVPDGDPSTARDTIRESALPVLDDLLAVTHRTIRLGVLRQCAAAYIERAAGNPTATEFGVKPPLPLHASALGKILLAFSAPELFEAAAAGGLAAFTSRTITDPARLRSELIQVRRAGVAANWGELDQTTSAMAVAVFGPGGQVVAALGLPVTGQADLARLQNAILIAGRTLSRRLATPVADVPGGWEQGLRQGAGGGNRRSGRGDGR